MGASAEKFAWISNIKARQKGSHKASTHMFSPKIACKIRNFHQTLPQYQPTPLVPLKNLARHLSLVNIRVKDESQRCRLNAFKVLGASYGLCSTLADQLGLNLDKMSFSDFLSPRIQERLAEMTCITATDGNHGRAVAWVAQKLGCRAVVYLPRGSSLARLENVRLQAADADIIDGNYDDAVKLAAENAHKNNWLLIQDIAKPGYEEIPVRIMQGYLTMFEEIFEISSNITPTHVFVQCGVGSFAAALQAYLVERFSDQRPILTVVEPTKAACFYTSAKHYDGGRHKIAGDLNTIMAGLACGEPSTIAWEILRDFADMFVACPDETTMVGMRILGNPLRGDNRIISGESGAVTLGLLYEILKSPSCMPLKKALHLNHKSDVLLFSTEGDTDPAMYRKIVWGSESVGND